tara:strand:+ start:428 stop:613 length:186 start_codon:yes stop_codon:yes gene_type:complete
MPQVVLQEDWRIGDKVAFEDVYGFVIIEILTDSGRIEKGEDCIVLSAPSGDPFVANAHELK